MKKQKRQSILLEHLTANNNLRVAAIAAELDVSTETIRRDLKELQAQGLAEKIYGAARIPELMEDSPFQVRIKLNSQGKQRIGRALANILKDGDSVILETGTTIFYAAQALRTKKNLRIVTNSLEVARTLLPQKDNQVFLAGGRLSPNDGVALDKAAIDYISSFSVGYSVSSSAGLDAQSGFTAHRTSEAEFSRAIIQQAKKRIVLIDEQKFHRVALVKVFDFADVDIVITDRVPPEIILRKLEAADIDVIVAD